MENREWSEDNLKVGDNNLLPVSRGMIDTPSFTLTGYNHIFCNKRVSPS
jgi:hypothetical protein